MKTFEFKLDLTPEQEKLINEWLDTLKHVWNRGLALLEWRQHYLRFQECLEVSLDANEDWGFDIKPTVIRKHKIGDDWVCYCDCASEFRVDRSLGREIQGNLELRPVVNLVKPHWQEPPLLESASAIALRKPFAKKRYPKIGSIPSVYFNDFIGLVLQPAWEQYQKGVKKKPQYKRKRDKVKTILSESFRSQGKIDGRKIKLPGLDWLVVKTLDARLFKDVDISTFKICKKASGYFLQLGVTNEPVHCFKPKTRKAGIAFGANQLFTVDCGRSVPATSTSDLEEKIKQLQYRSSKRKGRKFPMEVGSKNYQKLQKKIGSLHEKASRRRLGRQHWHSSDLVDIYGEIAISDLETSGLIQAPDPVLDPECERYLPNGAEVQALTNHAFSNAGIGQFKTLLKQKSESAKRKFNAIPPKQITEHLGDKQPSRLNVARTVLAISELPPPPVQLEDPPQKTAKKQKNREKKRNRLKKREKELLPST